MCCVKIGPDRPQGEPGTQMIRATGLALRKNGCLTSDSLETTPERTSETYSKTT